MLSLKENGLLQQPLYLGVAVETFQKACSSPESFLLKVFSLVPYLRKAQQLRREAALCREIARSISLRPDRDKLLAMAKSYEAEAAALEATQAKERGRKGTE